MPKGDETGPMGMGPMTGRGAGNCVGTAVPRFANRGIGFRRGMGGGRGLRRKFCLTAMPSEQAMDEKTILKNHEDLLEKQLQQVKERLKDFDEKK